MFKRMGIYFALGGLIAAFFLAYSMNKGVSDKKTSTTATPTLKPHTYSIAASGIIEAFGNNVLIGVPAGGGIVTKIDVEVGQAVKKGQILFSLDDRVLLAQKGVQEGIVKVRGVQLGKVVDQLQRLQSLKDTRAISEEQLKIKEFEVEEAKAELELSRSELKQTETLLECLKICSPIDGVVLQKNIEEGQYVDGSSGCYPLILGNINEFQVCVDVDEYNAYKVQKEGSAYAYPKGRNDVKIPLEFVRIEPFIVPKVSLTGASDEKVDTRVLQVIYKCKPLANSSLYVGQQVDVFIEETSKNLDKNKKG